MLISNNLQKSLAEFVQYYKGDPISIVTCGAGIGLNNILRIPGASRIINFINNLYSKDSTNLFLGHDVEHYCDREQVIDLLRTLSANEQLSTHFGVAVTGALSTNSHWRKGEVHAYVAMGTYSNYKVFHIELPKPTAEQWDALQEEEIRELRAWEDDLISEVVLYLIKFPLDKFPFDNKQVRITDVTIARVPANTGQ